MKDDYLTRRFSDATLAAKIVSHHKRLPTLRMLARQPFVCWMVATVFERCYSYRGYGEHPPRLTPFYVNILIVQTNRRLQFYYGKNENELVMFFFHPWWLKSWLLLYLFLCPFMQSSSESSCLTVSTKLEIDFSCICQDKPMGSFTSLSERVILMSCFHSEMVQWRQEPADKDGEDGL